MYSSRLLLLLLVLPTETLQGFLQPGSALEKSMPFMSRLPNYRGFSKGSSSLASVMTKLRELDSLIVRVIVDNESDTMSNGITCVAGFEYMSEKQSRKSTHQTPLCRAGHGLSLLLQATQGDATHTLLFDAGPDPDLWNENVNSLGITLSTIEATMLSHYHWDHSAGLRGAVPSIVRSSSSKGVSTSLLVDLQADQIVSRGRPLPDNDIEPHHPDNPTVDELEDMGAHVELNRCEHTLCDDFFYVSGYIPRDKNDYEKGIPGHVTYRNGKWMPDTEIPDERYLACRVKGRGLVVFSACSHSGIINVCRDVQQRGSTNDSLGHIFGIIGGLHLAGGQVEERIPQTLKDLKLVNPNVVLAGHCTGWKAKAMLATEMDGRFQPLAVGASYKFFAPI